MLAGAVASTLAGAAVIVAGNAANSVVRYEGGMCPSKYSG